MSDITQATTGYWADVMEVIQLMLQENSNSTVIQVGIKALEAQTKLHMKLLEESK